MAAQTVNEVRADRAHRAVLYWQQGAYDSLEEIETAAVDLMADLLHLLDRDYGITAENAHALAWEHFVAEKEGEE